MALENPGTFVGSSWLYGTALDFARLPFLYLLDGVWGGVRVLPEGWAECEDAATGEFYYLCGVAGLRSAVELADCKGTSKPAAAFAAVVWHDKRLSATLLLLIVISPTSYNVSG